VVLVKDHCVLQRKNLIRISSKKITKKASFCPSEWKARVRKDFCKELKANTTMLSVIIFALHWFISVSFPLSIKA